MGWQRYLVWVLVAAAVAVLGLLALRGLVALISKRPVNLGVRGGKLASCPASPNCVSTQSEDGMHGMAPIPYTTPTEEARGKIVTIIRSMERTRIITETSDYMYAEFRTSGLRYVDDVEFYFDAEAGVIHFRSAARLPYWDWNVNRKRMEAIRSAFESNGG